jgi:Domain of unknown function (DUF5615)
MIRVITDHNFDGRIIRGLLACTPKLDLITARVAGLARASDLEILEWALGQKRLLLTQDTNTMPAHIRTRAAAGQSHAGVVMVPQSLRVGRAIQDLQVVVECTEEHEWIDWVLYLPL